MLILPFSALFLTLLTLGLGSVFAFPDPLQQSGTVLVHDPSMVKRVSDGKYYLFSTHNLGAILTSTSLSGYVRIMTMNANVMSYPLLSDRGRP